MIGDLLFAVTGLKVLELADHDAWRPKSPPSTGSRRDCRTITGGGSGRLDRQPTTTTTDPVNGF